MKAESQINRCFGPNTQTNKVTANCSQEVKIQFDFFLLIIFFFSGLTVVIRCPDSNNTNSGTVGTALPKFAIRGMLKTFGLHGVVLDVDSVSTILIFSFSFSLLLL